MVNAEDKFKYAEALESTLTDMANYNPFGSSDIAKIVDKVNKPKDMDPDEVIYLRDGKMGAYIAKFKFDPTHDNFVKLIEVLPNEVGIETYINNMDMIFDALSMINSDTTQYYITLVKINEALLSCCTLKINLY